MLVDASDIPASLSRVEITNYSWTQEEGGFEVEVRVELPEPVSRSRCRVGFGERAAELWARLPRGTIPSMPCAICPCDLLVVSGE